MCGSQSGVSVAWDRGLPALLKETGLSSLQREPVDMKKQGDTTKWDHRWFGWWGEQHGFSYPFIYDFKKHRYDQDEIDHIVKYLESGYTISKYASKRLGCLICDSVCNYWHNEGGKSQIMTDGVYAWPSDLVHYVKFHGVVLPHDFYDNIKRNPLRETDNACVQVIESVVIAFRNQSPSRRNVFNILSLMYRLWLSRRVFDKECHDEIVNQIKVRAASRMHNGDKSGYWQDMNAISYSLSEDEYREMKKVFDELIDSGRIDF